MPDAQDGGLQNTRVQEQENICSCSMAVITETRDIIYKMHGMT